MAKSSSTDAVAPGSSVDVAAYSTGINLAAFVPVLVGLSAPIVVVAVLSPGSVVHIRFLFIALLAALLAVSTVMFVLSLLLDGQLTDLLVDQDERRFNLVYANAIASRRRAIRFEDIVSLRLTFQYDDDGYRYAAPELVLRDGQRELLPIAVSEAEIRAIREAIGLVT